MSKLFAEHCHSIEGNTCSTCVPEGILSYSDTDETAQIKDMQLFGEDADVASMHSYVLELESEGNLVYKNPQTSRQ